MHGVARGPSRFLGVLVAFLLLAPAVPSPRAPSAESSATRAARCCLA